MPDSVIFDVRRDDGGAYTASGRGLELIVQAATARELQHRCRDEVSRARPTGEGRRPPVRFVYRDGPDVLFEVVFR